MSTSTTEQIVLSVQRSTPRLWLAAAVGAVTLVVLYAALPLAGVAYPAARPILEPVAGGAARLLSAIDITTVLVVVAALTVVSIAGLLVIGNLSGRRGQIQSQEDRGGTQIVNARVPLSEMFGYSTDLRSRTQGRATYSMHFDRYEPAPGNVSEEVVARVQGK